MDQELIIFPSLSLRLQMVIQKLVPAIQKLVPASQKLPAARSDPEALSHPDAVGVEGPLAVWKKESYWKTWKKEQDAKQDWKKDWKKEDWPKESWKQVWKKEGWKKEGWKKEDWPQEDPEDARVLGRKCLGEALFARCLEKGEGHERQEEKGLDRGPDHEPQARGQVGWRQAICFLEAASPHERGLLVLFNLHAGWRVTE